MVLNRVKTEVPHGYITMIKQLGFHVNLNARTYECHHKITPNVYKADTLLHHLFKEFRRVQSVNNP